MGFFKKVVEKAAKVVGVSTSSNPFKKLIEKAAKESKKKKGIPKIDLIRPHEVTKFTNPNFERFARKYAKSEPELLFAAEYIVNDKFVGVLLAWEKFFDSTHYEVFKKNVFSAAEKWDRILFLDAPSLAEESKHYIDYVEKTIGLDVDNDDIYIILDTVVKEDRIYEYKVRAARVPSKATEVDYDYILESKNLTKSLTVDQTSANTLYDFAGVTLGSYDLAWTLALMNEQIQYFGKSPLEKPLVKFSLARNEDREEFILVPTDINNIMTIINDSIALFGIKDTFSHLIRAIGGLGSDFRETFLSSIDETRNVFSYDNFRKEIKKKVPVFSLVLSIAESGGTGNLSKLSVVLPTNKGSESLSSIESVTKVVKFVNEFFVAAIYSQDNSNKIGLLLAEIKLGTVKAEPLEKATSLLVGTVPIENETNTSNSSHKSEAAESKRRLPTKEEQEEAKEQREEDARRRSEERQAGDRTKSSGSSSAYGGKKKAKKAKKKARVKK